MFSINQTENCAIGKFRMQILQIPQYIECVKRTPTYQINLVETKKFATYDLVHKGEGRRRHQKLSNYKYYKKFVKQEQQDAESLNLDGHHCAQTTSGNSEIMSAVEPNDFLSKMCVELTVQPNCGSNSIVSGTCRKNELIHFRHCVCDI
jgi:hypothetical protein